MKKQLFFAFGLLACFALKGNLAAMNQRYNKIENLMKHGIDVDAKTVSLGPWLKIDRKNECFKNNEQANRLVRGFYREPYVVPDLSV